MPKTYQRELTLVIPAFNEARRLPASLERLRSFAADRPYVRRVVVVDDGSTDETVSVAQEAARSWSLLHVLQLDMHRGKGAAVRAGVLAGNHHGAVGFTDADLSADITMIDELVDALNFVDIAFASRGVPGAELIVREPPLRELVGKGYAALVRTTTLRGIPDAHCGLKCYRSEAASMLFARSRIDGVLFDLEVFVLASRYGLTMAQFPATWQHHRGSRLGLGPRFAANVLRDLMLIKLRHRSLLWHTPRLVNVRAQSVRGRPSKPVL